MLDSLTPSEESFELNEFEGINGKHHVVWETGPMDYPVWMCQTHAQPYFTYCLEGKNIAEKAFAQNI